MVLILLSSNPLLTRLISMQQKQKFLSIFSNIESTFPSNQLLKIPALDWKWFLIIFPLEFVLIYLLNKNFTSPPTQEWKMTFSPHHYRNPFQKEKNS